MKRDKALAVFIPQDQFHAAEAFQNGDMADAAQFRVVSQHLRKPVIWHPARKMVDVMDADIGR
jgi:hypothetical protein